MANESRWYVLEMKGGGLLTVCLPEHPRGKQLLIAQSPEAPNVIGITIAENSYDVLKDYSEYDRAMAFIEGLELGHQRLRERENKLERMYQSKRRAL